MLLMIDNYDSFTYNLVQYFGELGEEVLTIRNDEITLDDIRKLNPERICLSPGPCSPKEAGICVDLLKEFMQLVGFGKFVVVKRAAGVARNPKTGERVKRAASSTCRFHAGDALKNVLNS